MWYCSGIEVKRVIERLFQEVLGGPRDLRLLDKILSADHVDHSTGQGQPADRAGVRPKLEALRAAFPDVVFFLDDSVCDQTIGDLFSLRVAGNVMSPDFLGSLEYAAKVTSSKLILVLGHSDCGAVKGAIDRVQLGNLTDLLSKIEPAVAAAAPGTSKDAAYVARVSEQNVRLAMKHIRDESPVLKELLDKGALGLAGGMYDLKSGRVTIYAD